MALFAKRSITDKLAKSSPKRKISVRREISPLSDRCQLEQVIGITATNCSSLTCDPSSGTIAYLAGCVIVLYNPKTNRQSHIFNTARKCLKCVAFSEDGRYIVSGESGHLPAVRVWDLSDNNNQAAEYLGHKFSVACVAFSPNNKLVVSVGDQHDMSVNVWSLKTGQIVACNKISVQAQSLSFAEDGSYFVTAGLRHVRFWYFAKNSSKVGDRQPLIGRSGLLGELRSNMFCDVACGIGDNASSTYCITKSGLLCCFNSKRMLEKWVELKASSASSVVVDENYIYCGCSSGIVRIFNCSTLGFVTSLPKPHRLGIDLANSVDPSAMVYKADPDIKYPDVVAMVYDSINKLVTCTYNDHSLYIWNLRDLQKIDKSRSFLFHAGCVWDVKVYRVANVERAHLPVGSFVTCSSDDTIRFWNLDLDACQDTLRFRKNIFSDELFRVLYTDKEFTNLVETVTVGSSNTPASPSVEHQKSIGVRCMNINNNGQYLASGDRSGFIRIHDLQFMDELVKVEAHDAEVLCVSFLDVDSGHDLLASASRDRLIHVFHFDGKSCNLVQTIDDHSGSITSVHFAVVKDNLHLLSCGTDKSILFRTAQEEPEFQFIRSNIVVSKTTLYDMDIDCRRKFAVTACQDRNVRIYNIKTGKLKKSYKGSVTDDGTLIKVALDPSGSYVATSSSDKFVSIHEFYSGDCIAQMSGHAEIITGIAFTNDGERLITVSGDSCIFVWKLPSFVTQTIQEKLLGKSDVKDAAVAEDLRRGTYTVSQRQSHKEYKGEEEEEEEEEEDLERGSEVNYSKTYKKNYRYSFGQLPAWAKRQMEVDEPETSNTGTSNEAAQPQGKWAQTEVDDTEASNTGTSNEPAQPQGRWAQRVDAGGINLLSVLDDSQGEHITVALENDDRRLTFESEDCNTSIISQNGRNANSEGAFTPKVENTAEPSNLVAETSDNKDLISKVKLRRNNWRDDQTKTTTDKPVDDINLLGKQTAYSSLIKSNSTGEIKKAYRASCDASSFQVKAPVKPSGDSDENIKEKSGSGDPSDDNGENEEINSADIEKQEEIAAVEGNENETKNNAKDFLYKNYESLEASTYEQATVKSKGEIMDATSAVSKTQDVLHRSSISARFLSRSQHTTIAKNVSDRKKATNDAARTEDAVSRNFDELLQKRKEEMAKAVDRTRKRLIELGFATLGSRKLSAPQEQIEENLEKQPLSSKAPLLKTLSNPELAARNQDVENTVNKNSEKIQDEGLSSDLKSPTTIDILNKCQDEEGEAASTDMNDQLQESKDLSQHVDEENNLKEGNNSIAMHESEIVVDDNDIADESLCEALSSAGHNVDEQRSSSQISNFKADVDNSSPLMKVNRQLRYESTTNRTDGPIDKNETWSNSHNYQKPSPEKSITSLAIASPRTEIGAIDYRDTIENLQRSFKAAADLHSSLLDCQPTERNSQMLSELVSHFTRMQEQLAIMEGQRRQRLRQLASGGEANSSVVGESSRILSMQEDIAKDTSVNLDKTYTLLDNYSDALLEILKNKLQLA